MLGASLFTQALLQIFESGEKNVRCELTRISNMTENVQDDTLTDVEKLLNPSGLINVASLQCLGGRVAS